MLSRSRHSLRYLKYIVNILFTSSSLGKSTTTLNLKAMNSRIGFQNERSLPYD